MKNLQTILLGLVIVLGIIYVGYNEQRLADADDSHTHKETVAMVNLNKEELLTVKKRVAYFEGLSVSLIDKVSLQKSPYHCHSVPIEAHRTNNPLQSNQYKEVCD